MNKTITQSLETIERNWFLVDAKDKTLGRLATEIATVLRGKNKPTFTPHLDTGDFVIVVNACLLYTSPSPRDWMVSRMPSSA